MRTFHRGPEKRKTEQATIKAGNKRAHVVETIAEKRFFSLPDLAHVILQTGSSSEPATSNQEREYRLTTIKPKSFFLAPKEDPRNWIQSCEVYLECNNWFRIDAKGSTSPLPSANEMSKHGPHTTQLERA